MPNISLVARISSASETITPVNRSSPRSSPVSAAPDTVAGRSPVSSGTRRWLGMMARVPALIAASNGGRSRRRRSSSPPSMVAMACVGVGAGAAVPGEVLGARGHARALQADHRGGGVPGHQAGVRAEGPGADGRAVRRAEHVGARREVEVDPQGGQVGADRPVHRPGQDGVVHRAERGVARVRAAVGVRDPGDVAALLVDRDHRVDPDSCGAKPGRQCAHLIRSRDVLAEERDPGQAAAERVEDPARGRGAGKRRDEDGVGQPDQQGVRGPDRRVLAHPFTAPATRPLTIRRWTMRKKTITGMVNRVEAAMMPPQSTDPRP